MEQKAWGAGRELKTASEKAGGKSRWGKHEWLLNSGDTFEKCRPRFPRGTH